MDFKECVKKRIIKKTSSDLDLIESLKKSSSGKLESSRMLKVSNVTAGSIITLAYDSLRELLEAVALKNRYKVYNHECYYSFLKDIVNNNNLALSFDKIRKIRNSVNYYGKGLSVEDAKQIFDEICILILQCKKLL